MQLRLTKGSCTEESIGKTILVDGCANIWNTTSLWFVNVAPPHGLDCTYMPLIINS